MLTTYAGDCSTPKTVFNVQDTVCVQITGVPLDPSAQRSLSWSTTNSTIVRRTDVTSDPQTDSLVVNATSVINGITIDNRGTWQLTVLNPFFFFPEVKTTFTVVDPANPTADLAVATILTPSGVETGSQAVFELQVDNYGPDSSANVQLTDAVPNGTTFVSFQQLSGPVFTCNNPAGGGTGTTTCSISSFGKDQVARFVATYQVNNGAATGSEISNTVSVSSATNDQNNLNDSTSASTTVKATPCVLTCPSNITQNADSGQAGAVVTYSDPTSTGDCGQTTTGEDGEPIPAVTCSPASGSFFDLGTTTVICSGQTGAVCTFQVTIENPGNGLSITLNGANPFTLECGTDFNDPGATAKDGNNNSVPVTVAGTVDSHTSGSYTLTYTATEGQNSVSTTRTVNVADTAAPVIALAGPNPMTVGCGSPFVDPGASAVDACEGSLPVTITGTVDTHTPGTYTISYSATDSHNNSTTVTRTVNVVDTQPPAITCPADITTSTDAGQCSGTVDPGTATATDNCSSNPTVTGTRSDGQALNAPYPKGSTTITWTATDGAGNSSSCAQTVTVNDTEKPTISCPANITRGDDPGSCSATIDPGTARATDNCGNPIVTGTRSDGQALNAPYPNGTTTITWTATDGSGNSSSCTQTVTVSDTEPPKITCPANITQSTDPGSCSANINPGTATATDNCGNPTVTGTRSDGQALNAPYPKGTTTITWTATDGSNNSSSCTQTITVNDTEPPKITCPANITTNTLPGTCSAVVITGTATASDNCGSTTVTGSRSDGKSVTDLTYPGGTTTITWTATDSSGNQSSCTQTITVNDNEAPTITLNGQTPSMWPPNHSYHTFQVTDFVTSASDNCDTSVNRNSVYITKVTSDEAENGPGSGNTLNDIVIAADCKSVQLRAERESGGDGRVYTIFFKAKDASGNFTTATAKVVAPVNQGGTTIDSGPRYTVTSSCP